MSKTIGNSNSGNNATIVKNGAVASNSANASKGAFDFVPYVVGGIGGSALTAGVVWAHSEFTRDSFASLTTRGNELDDDGGTIVAFSEPVISGDGASVTIPTENGGSSFNISGNPSEDVNGHNNPTIINNGNNVTINIIYNDVPGSGSNNESESVVIPAPEQELVNPADNPPVPSVEHNDIDFATLQDGLSFANAFANARLQVGSGGAFVWHGNVYGTYYENEWDAMTPEQRHQFTHDAIVQWHEYTPEQQYAMDSSAIHSSPLVEDNTGSHNQSTGNPEVSHSNEYANTEVVADIEEQNYSGIGDNVEEVQVVAFTPDQDPSQYAESTPFIQVVGGEVNGVVPVSIGGQDGLALDITGNGEIDAVSVNGTYYPLPESIPTDDFINDFTYGPDPNNPSDYDNSVIV